MDFEPCFKVHNVFSVQPKRIKLGQTTNLNVTFNAIYRLLKIKNAPVPCSTPKWPICVCTYWSDGILHLKICCRKVLGDRIVKLEFATNVYFTKKCPLILFWNFKNHFARLFEEKSLVLVKFKVINDLKNIQSKITTARRIIESINAF